MNYAEKWLKATMEVREECKSKLAENAKNLDKKSQIELDSIMGREILSKSQSETERLFYLAVCCFCKRKQERLELFQAAGIQANELSSIDFKEDKFLELLYQSFKGRVNDKKLIEKVYNHWLKRSEGVIFKVNAYVASGRWNKRPISA